MGKGASMRTRRAQRFSGRVRRRTSSPHAPPGNGRPEYGAHSRWRRKRHAHAGRPRIDGGVGDDLAPIFTPDEAALLRAGDKPCGLF
jgi:hypothetical protein